MKASFAIAATIVLNGCASIVSGGADTIPVNSYPQEAFCNISGQNVRTPSQVALNHTCNDVTVTCHKDGYYDSSGQIVSSTNPWVFGNILFGGIVGLLIDAASGNMCHFTEGTEVALEQKLPVAGS